MLIKLISSPIQQINQEFDEMAIRVPDINRMMKIILYCLNNKKKEIFTLIEGV